MRTAVIIAALCAAFSVVAVAYRDPGGPDVYLAGLAIALAFYPTLIVSILLLAFGLFRLAEPRTRAAAAAVVVLSLPMPTVAVFGAASQNNRNKSSHWPGLAMTLADHLLDYHQKNPGAFKYLGSDDQVSVAGFAEYLAGLDLDTKTSPVSSLIRAEGGDVLDPWGKPIRFALDRDHDGYIELQGQRLNTSGVSPPNLDYTVAVAVYLSHPDNGEVRPLIRRKKD
jgi:hypothetical protein